MSTTMSTAVPLPSPMDPDQERRLQQRLVLLLHAFNCHRLRDPSKQCPLYHCQTMAEVIIHMQTCYRGKCCPVPHCAASRWVISHYKNCHSLDCPVCGLWLSKQTDHKMQPHQIPESWPIKRNIIMKMLVDEEANPFMIDWVDESRCIFRLQPLEMLTQVRDPCPDKTRYNYAYLMENIKYHCHRRGFSLVRDQPNMYVCGPNVIAFMNRIIIDHNRAIMIKRGLNP
ncbi:unnamed protein product [Meganyctiphanes norvegica]|uniref:histone acetyltransferase n=1 Tax=Meganyctiphanes norvegica TaxID=48144 RepID=A0AAV2RPW0_MEGNR